MPRKSPSIKTKLDRLFTDDPVTEEFGTLLDGSLSPSRFDNKGQLADYLCEGALLNISRIASKALSVPSGEYMVWVTDVGHTMLVPTQNKTAYSEVFEGLQDQYEILTPNLLQHWSGVERVLSEEQEPGMQFGSDSGSEASKSGGEDGETTGASPIQSRVNPGDIDRPPMLRAMEDRGFTVSSLAQAAGVQPPAISRLLRTPKERQGDPGGRNPSMGLAATISQLLRMDPTALFPDIFGASGQDMQARQQPGNRGSGMTGAAAGSVRKGKATEKWTQGGSPSESKNGEPTISEYGEPTRTGVSVGQALRTTLANSRGNTKGLMSGLEFARDNAFEQDNQAAVNAIDRIWHMAERYTRSLRYADEDEAQREYEAFIERAMDLAMSIEDEPVGEYA